MHEQYVALGAPGDRLVDGPTEQTLEKAVLAAADDDQIGTALLGHLEQTLGRIAHIDNILRLGLAALERDPRSLELPPRKLLRRG